MKTWTCIRCDKELQDAEIGTIQPVDGTVFLGSPGYGSSLDCDHQDLDNVDDYVIALCDDCMETNRDKILGIKTDREKHWMDRSTIVKLEPDRLLQMARQFTKNDIAFLEKGIKDLQEYIESSTNSRSKEDLEKRLSGQFALLAKVKELNEA